MTSLLPEDVKKLKVIELKEELSNRGLSTAGLKKTLVSRLIKALGSGIDVNSKSDASEDAENESGSEGTKNSQEPGTKSYGSDIFEEDFNNSQIETEDKSHSEVKEDMNESVKSQKRTNVHPIGISNSDYGKDISDITETKNGGKYKNVNEVENEETLFITDSVKNQGVSSTNDEVGANHYPRENESGEARGYVVTVEEIKDDVNQQNVPVSTHVAFEENIDDPLLTNDIELDSIDRQPLRVELDQTEFASELVKDDTSLDDKESEKENHHSHDEISSVERDHIHLRNPLATIYEKTSLLGTDYQNISDRSLSISRLLPPFSNSDLEEFLEQFGEITDFYLNFAKSQCFVRYAMETSARNALASLQSQRWPPQHGEILFVTSIPFDSILKSIELESKLIGSSLCKGFEHGQKRSFDEIDNEDNDRGTLTKTHPKIFQKLVSDKDKKRELSIYMERTEFQIGTRSPNNDASKENDVHYNGSLDGSGLEDIFEDIMDEDTIFDPSLLEGCDSSPEDDTTSIPSAFKAVPLSTISKFSDMDIDDGSTPDKTNIYLPHMPIGENSVLEVNNSVYNLFRELNVEWPCLSFDYLSASDTNINTSLTLVAGSQAGVSSKNRLFYIKTGELKISKKNHSSSTGYASSSSDLSSEEEDGDEADSTVKHDSKSPTLSSVSIPHQGSVNRIRVSTASGIPNYVASWSDLGNIFIWNPTNPLAALEVPANFVKTSFIGDNLRKKQKQSKNKELPVAIITGHNATEGYSLSWSNKGTPGRLLTGDCGGKIILSQLDNENTLTQLNMYSNTICSIEDLVWSPSEAEVFASCDTMGMIRIWDSRQSNTHVAHVKGSQSDINVLSWNPINSFLLASGHDDGVWATWDLRKLALSSSMNETDAVVLFNWHTKSITSIEWNPYDSSVITVSGSDDQLTIWDLALEQDNDNRLDEDVPPQLLFIHQGQQDMKEAHWAPSPNKNSLMNGVIASTSATGFHIFKPINI